MERFADRSDAGRLLGARLNVERSRDTIVVLGLPRGGVVVAFEVARVLKAPLDVVVVRKVGVPSQPELAMGALAEGGVSVKEHEICAALHISEGQFSQAASNERDELVRRIREYRQGHPMLDLAGRIVIMVDDGVATGATARAAIASVRRRGPARIVLAAPVASAESAREIGRLVDEIVALASPHGPFSVGSFYERFAQTSDEEVATYLARARSLRRHGRAQPRNL